MSANRHGSTRSTQDGGTGSAPSSNPTIILDGENIVSQSPGFDTTGTSGGTGNYNVGTSTITEGSDGNWIEGLNNLIDGNLNLVLGNNNQVVTGDVNNISGRTNLVNGSNINIRGNTNNIEEKNTIQLLGDSFIVDQNFYSGIGEAGRAFSENNFIISNRLSAIHKRDDLAADQFLFRSGAKAIFLTQEIDLKSVATYTFNMPAGSKFALLGLSLIKIVAVGGGGGATIQTLTDSGGVITTFNSVDTAPVNSIQLVNLGFGYLGTKVTFRISVASAGSVQIARFLIEGILTNL